jgi:hypothetical protein
MDGHSYYNKVFFVEEYVSMIAFGCHRSLEMFRWTLISFGLKKASATY